MVDHRAIREHMDVIDSEVQANRRVDSVEGSRIKLTRTNSPDRLEARTGGESNPEASDESAAGKAVNRCTELVISTAEPVAGLPFARQAPTWRGNE